MGAILIWWLSILLIGIGYLPLSVWIFQKFDDRGWLFSKVIGLFLTGWLLWVFSVLKVLQFRQRNVLLLVLICSLLNYLLYALYLRKRGLAGSAANPLKDLSASSVRLPLVICEEVMFAGLFLFAVYVIGFRPDAYGTEKFMDYGFMTAMSRANYLPFEDLWYAGYSVNYYYGGQYYASFLMKMTGLSAGISYNLMRGTITALSFALPFSLAYQLMRDKMGQAALSPWFAGFLGGAATAFGGNGHYLVYGIFLPLIRGKDKPHYWFPDSTRYIGYKPDLPDKTIHEFPAYSSIVGDLHAHYINLIFVLAVLAVVYAWAQKEDPRRPDRRPVLRPELVLIGIFTGLFRWTNFWDFPIYFVVTGSILFFVNLRTYWGEFLRWLGIMLGEVLEILLVGYLVSLPFTASFYQISSRIGLTHSHTLLRQLTLLWGLPAGIFILFAGRLIFERVRMKKTLPLALVHARRLALPDLTVLLWGLCAAGLVFLPEVIYVKDIYGKSFYRANTMFKLTYQAFILFALVMAYVLVRTLADKGKILKVVGGAALVLLLLTIGYTGLGVSGWFGDIFKPEDRVSTDASVFISRYYPSDYEAVKWLNERVEGTPTLLEAPGDSYSEYERISAATGLPTVAGWYVHEWLWRGGHEEEDQRIADVRTIYTSKDAAEVKRLLQSYDISYIYIGKLEREKYPGLQDKVLQSLGETVWSDGVSTYILRVGS